MSNDISSQGGDVQTTPSTETGSGASDPTANSQGANTAKQSTVPHQALHDERSRRKAAEDEAAKAKAKLKEMEESKLAEQGQYQDLASNRLKEIEELKTQNESMATELNAFKNESQKRIELQLGNIGEEKDRELVKAALEGKPLAQQETLLSQLMPRFTANRGPHNPSPPPGQPPVTENKEERIAHLIKLKQSAGPTEILRINREISSLKAS